jgi:enoyl-CoA hydratase
MSIDLAVREQIATVTINNPDRLNALDEEHLQDLLTTFRSIARDNAVRVVILTGAGDRAFVAGANIKRMSTMTADEALEFARLGHAVASEIERLPQPVIVAINGFALGGGCELSLAADIRICSTNAVFAQPEVGLGIPPGWGGTQRLSLLVGRGMAAEMIYSGRRVKAEEALRIGLVNSVHEPHMLMEFAHELARSIAVNSPAAVRASKSLIARAFDGHPASGLAEEARAFAKVFGSADQKEGMSAFVEKRTPTFNDIQKRDGEENA